MKAADGAGGGGPPAAAGPAISVVIASVTGGPVIGDCLAALAAGDAPPYEAIVVDRVGGTTRSMLAAAGSPVRLIEAPAGTPLPRLIASGVQAARAPIVALLDDHCVAEPGWLRAVERAFAEGWRAVSGAVLEDRPATLADRAALLLEYGAFQPPFPRQAGPLLTCCCAVDREVLTGLGAELDGLWGPHLSQRLAAAGVASLRDPDLSCRHRLSQPLAESLAQRFHFSRVLAAARWAALPAWRRALLAAATVALPVLLGGRAWVTARRLRTPPARLAAMAPILCALLCAGAAGEALGAARGAGASPGKVR